MLALLFNVCLDGVMKEVKVEIGNRSEVFSVVGENVDSLASRM